MSRLGFFAKRLVRMDWKKMWETTGLLKERSGKSRLWLLSDMLRCGIKFNAGYMDYKIAAMYNLNDEQKKTVITRGISNSIVRRMNDKAYWHYFDDKTEFNTLFADQIGRRWIRSDEKLTEEQLTDFLSGLPSVLFKPLEGSSGVGIEKFSREAWEKDPHAFFLKIRSMGNAVLEELLVQPLDWDLHSGAPTVLILHTHATESYTKAKGEVYKETSAFRTLDEEYNMVSVGDRVAKLLEAGGITVIHDRQLHDYPSYNGSYNHARKSMAEILKKYPTIRLVLDLHRDASGDNYNQMRTEAEVNGKASAQLMLVIGTDASGLKHPQWEENLALGLKLHSQLERIAPGICRYVNLRGQRFNQDLSPGALLVEVGAAGNSHEEALIAAEVLAQGILDLANGTSVS